MLAFYRDTLVPSRDERRRAHERALEDVEQWCEFAKQLETLMQRDDPEGAFEALVDLGGEVKARARVPSAETVFVDVGLGFMAEMTLEEATRMATDAKATCETEARACLEALEKAERACAEFESRLRQLMGLG